MALPLLLILLLAGCPHNNSIETRTLSYDANLPEGHSLSSGTLPGTKVYMKGARVVVAAAGELITTEGDVGSSWNTMPDGSGDNYFGGEEFTLDSDTTLYAQWPSAQKIMDTADAVDAIGKMEPGEKLDLTLGGEVDLSQLKEALSQAKGTISLDLSQAEGVTAIGEGAFQGITALDSVTLPEGVASIGANAFAGSGLTSITLPNTLQTIGEGAFQNTVALTSATVPEGVTSIGANAFAGSGLTSITLQSPAKNITIDDTAIPSAASIAVPPTELAAYSDTFTKYKDQFTGFVQYSIRHLFETTDGNYAAASSAGVSDASGIYGDKQVPGIPGQKTNVTASPAPTGFMDGQVTQVEIAEDAVVEVRYERKTVTITINSITGAGTSGLNSPFKGKYGTATNISPTPPASFTFVKWVDNSGGAVSIPTTFPAEDQIIEAANATFVNAAGYPVYPAYLTVQRTSYAEAENDDVGQEKPTWAEKIYSQQLVKRPISDPVFTDAFKFGDGSSQIPQRETLTVTAGGDGTSPSHGGVGTGNAKNGGSFRIPALISMTLPSGKTRVFAAMDVRYRGEEDGNGDCGTTNGGSDILILYSDDGGATWPGRKMIDVDNIWDESGKTNTMSHKTDLGDPALWTVGNKLYMGAVGGGPSSARTNMNGYTNTNRVFVSSDYGETWVEDTNISSNNGMAKPRETYSYLWNTKDGNLTNPGNGQGGYANLPCPGHGIILTKDVPNTNMKAGMTAVPMQGGGGTTNFATYIIYGNGEPSTWSKNGSIMVPNSGNGEWQICQLDDGTILSLGKNTNGPIEMRRYSGANVSEGWYTVDSDPWGGRKRGASQTSLLKVADGDGDKKGVVAFASPKQGGENPGTDFQDSGRNQVTVSFAADNSKSVATGEGSPLGDVRYYVQIRKMGQRYFGYTDMVMVDDELIGILYECFDTNNDLDGMRFITIDVSEIIKKLSTQQ